MHGAGGALVLVALQTVVGTFALMWVTMLAWRAVDRGHYRSATWVLEPTMLGLAFALPGDLRTLGLAGAAAFALFLAAVYSQRPLLEWLAGGAASAAGAYLVALVGVRACGGCPTGAAQALAGALFLGAVTHGMVLGHWYLNQPRLPIEPLKGASVILLAAAGGSLLAGVGGRVGLVAGRVPGGLLTFSSMSYWWAWLVLLACTALLGVMVRATVWSRSTQSATGLLYLAMITAIPAQFVLMLLLAS